MILSESMIDQLLLLESKQRYPEFIFSLCETAWMWTPVFNVLSPKPLIGTKVQ